MFDSEQLKTLLAVARTLSFTGAAKDLGLGQPTVSQHIRKLEAAVGRQLFLRDTRTVTLTADGEAMAGFARTIIAAQQDASDFFTGSGLRGRLRFGVSDDLALTALPRILRDFRRLYPRIDLELTVSQSGHLHRRLESGHLDLAFVQHQTGDATASVVRRDRLVWAAAEGVWAAAEGLTFGNGRVIPLVAYQAPSLSRAIAVQALEGAEMPYRITCTVRGVNGILAAVRAGLGIAVFARSLAPRDLIEIPPAAGLPELGEVDFVLLTGPRAPAEAAAALTTAILGNSPQLA